MAYDRYCICPEWVEKVDNVPSGRLEDLHRILEAYPDTCPYCKEPFEKRLKPLYVCVARESEFGREATISGDHFILLEELIEHLKELGHEFKDK